MSEAKRRLTIYPGQISMVINVAHAQEFLETLKCSIEAVPKSQRQMVERFLFKLESAIETGKRLSRKQSDLSKKEQDDLTC